MIIATDFLPYCQITIFQAKDNNEVMYAREEKKAPIAYRVLSERDKVPVNRKVLKFGEKFYKECENPLRKVKEEDKMCNEVDCINDYHEPRIIGRLGMSEAELSELFFDRYIVYKGKFYEQV